MTVWIVEFSPEIHKIRLDFQIGHRLPYGYLFSYWTRDNPGKNSTCYLFACPKKVFFTAYGEAAPQCINANAYSEVPNKPGALLTM